MVYNKKEQGDNPALFCELNKNLKEVMFTNESNTGD
jgi:hypothetical protein